MHPKRNLHQLNRQREVNRRLQFVKRRMVESMLELSFAIGRLPKLPEDMAQPPQWALEAAAWVHRHAFKEPTPAETARDPRGTIKNAIGIYEGTVAFVTQPLADAKDDRMEVDATQKLRKFVSGIYNKKTLKALRQFDAHVEQSLPPATPAQLFNHGKQHRKGVESVINAEGELQLIKTAQAEIHYVIWFFWPHLAKLVPTLTADGLHGWLKKENGIHTSLKTVEIIFARLKFASFKKPQRGAT